MSSILIVDDDTELCEMLSEYLSLEGFSISVVHDGASGERAAIEGDFQAVILDVMLPKQNGFDTLQQIRRSSLVPIIMLTAKGDDIDRILGLEMGADDYLPKPFNPRELSARLKAILRRSDPPVSNNSAPLEAGALSLKPTARKAFWRDQELTLTSTEFAILEILLRHAGTVVSKDMLYQKALGRPLELYDRSVDMHISHIRKKIPGGEQLIQTIRGTGYQLTLEP